MPAPLAHKNERTAVRPIEIEQRQARGVHFTFAFVEVGTAAMRARHRFASDLVLVVVLVPALETLEKPIVVPFAHIAALTVFRAASLQQLHRVAASL